MLATPKGLSEEKAARMMGALRKGQTLRLFSVTAPRLHAYFAAHPDYAREAMPLIEANAKAARLRKGAHIRNKTHCINGHSFVEHGRVAIHKGWKTRQCRACEVLRYHRGGITKPEVLKKATALIVAGSSLSSFTKPGDRARYLVRFNTLGRYRRENPEFDRLVVSAIKDSNRRAQRRCEKITIAAVREQNNDYYRIRSMLPAAFPGRDDVVSSIFEDLLSGKLQREDVRARIQSYMTAHNRLFPTKYAKFGNALLVSLDEVIFEDGTATRGDTVSRGLWD
jgi:hypothetical protein